jgi:type II secretory pathway component PulF
MAWLERIQIARARSELRKQRAGWYLDLSMALEDRIPLYSILKKYELRARTRHPAQALLYRQILRNSMKGALADALRGVAPASELMVLNASQISGDESVAAGLRFLSETVEKTERMTRTMRGAVNYPLFLLVLMAAIATGFSVFAVPVLEEIMPVDQWPTVGKILHSVSLLIRHYGVLMALGFVTILGVFFYSLNNWVGPWRSKVDSYLPYSLYRDYSGALLIVSLASLMKSGVSLRSALEQAMRYANPWMRWHLHKILTRLSSRDATNFGQAFATGVLSPELEDRIADASERREPVQAFVKIGVGSIDRISTSIEASAARINAYALMVCGFILGGMMLGFMSTTQQLNAALRTQVQQTNTK